MRKNKLIILLKKHDAEYIWTSLDKAEQFWKINGIGFFIPNRNVNQIEFFEIAREILGLSPWEIDYEFS